MPEICRVGVCGFDPMLVRGYVKTGYRALWWYIPDGLYEDFNVSPGDAVKGTLLAVYNYKGEKTAEPKESFSWVTAKESGLAVVLPGEVITKFELTEFHFIELIIEKVAKMDNGNEIEIHEVYPGEEKKRKFWPEKAMKLEFHLDYMAP